MNVKKSGKSGADWRLRHYLFHIFL